MILKIRLGSEVTIISVVILVLMTIIVYDQFVSRSRRIPLKQMSINRVKLWPMPESECRIYAIHSVEKQIHYL